MRNLLSFLSGSLGSVSQFYYMQSPAKWTSLRLQTFLREFATRIKMSPAFFFKDDWKILKTLR